MLFTISGVVRDGRIVTEKDLVLPDGTHVSISVPIAELPPEQREVIVLKIWHGCTFEEVGGLLEISPNTAAGRYRYGLQKIKLKLEADHESEFRMETDRDAVAFLASAPAI